MRLPRMPYCSILMLAIGCGTPRIDEEAVPEDEGQDEEVRQIGPPPDGVQIFAHGGIERQ